MIFTLTSYSDKGGKRDSKARYSELYERTCDLVSGMVGKKRLSLIQIKEVFYDKEFRNKVLDLCIKENNNCEFILNDNSKVIMFFLGFLKYGDKDEPRFRGENQIDYKELLELKSSIYQSCEQPEIYIDELFNKEVKELMKDTGFHQYLSFIKNINSFFTQLAVTQVYIKQSYLALSDNDVDSAWEYVSYANFNAGFITGLEKGRKDNTVTSNAKYAANISHSNHRETAELIKNWYVDHLQDFRSLDGAATKAIKKFPVSFRTARKHIGEKSKTHPLHAKSNLSK